MMNSKRNTVVVVDTYNGPIYLGTLDETGRGERCGVRRIENAIRFTSRGAKRVVQGYATALAEGRAYTVEAFA